MSFLLRSVTEVNTPLVCDQAAATSIVDDLRHQLIVNAPSSFRVAINQRLIAVLIDEARNAAAALMNQHDGGAREEVQASARHA